jgi:hypothetical protein
MDVLNKRSRTVDKEWSISFEVRPKLTNFNRKKFCATKLVQSPRFWKDSLERPRLCFKDTRTGAWNVRDLYITDVWESLVMEVMNYKPG